MYMMLMPKNNLDLFDDIFGGNFLSKVDNNMMRTDIRESENEYLIDVDLPGYSKENIKVDVTDGYLNINAKMNDSHDEKEKGKYVRRERYYGECSRSFYIGDDIKKDDIKNFAILQKEKLKIGMGALVSMYDSDMLISEDCQNIFAGCL